MTISLRGVTRGILAGVALGAALTMGVATAPAFSTAAHASDGPITRAQVIKRAMNWVHRNVQYSQGGTATGPNGKTRYRRDCSGFVSMTWLLKPRGMSAPTTSTLPKYAHKILKKNLKKGDILDLPGTHVVIFQNWVKGSHHSRIRLIEEANPTEDMNHYTAPLSKYHAYTAYRYNKIR